MRLLLQGDYDARYHSLHWAEQTLRELLDGDTLTIALDGTDIHPEGYDLVIQYTEVSGRTLTEAQSDRWLAWLSGGGRVLAIHNGISFFHNNPELVDAITGARFLGHPPRRDLTFTPLYSAAPVTLFEEPYTFSAAPEKQLLAFEMDGQVLPAGWARGVGDGRYVYLAPGHDASIFADDGYRRVLRDFVGFALDGVCSLHL